MAVDYSITIKEKYPEFFKNLYEYNGDSGTTMHELLHFLTACDTEYREGENSNE